jgi:(5-formylfuran-3-yl)methyl phosphate synthase
MQPSPDTEVPTRRLPDRSTVPELSLASPPGRMRLLVSVRSIAEAALAVRTEIDFIDLKEPRAGALGALPLATIIAIVDHLRTSARAVPISATIGDQTGAATPAILDRVAAIGACGVDLVKVGIAHGAHTPALLEALAGCERRVVPVFLADDGVDHAHLDYAARLGFPAVMLDTADKRSGSLLERVAPAELGTLVRLARRAGCPIGLAGALRLADWSALVRLAPDFAGFRSAVCAGARGDALDRDRLVRLVECARLA